MAKQHSPVVYEEVFSYGPNVVHVTGLITAQLNHFLSLGERYGSRASPQ